MGFEAFTNAFNSSYKASSERKSMFDEDDKKSSSHWGESTPVTDDSGKTGGDSYANFITGGADETLAETPPPTIGSYDQTNEADHQLLKDNNIMAFDAGEHGKESSFLSKIWKGTFGDGSTYDTSNDYYSAHLTKIKDQKGLDLVNQAKERNIPIPEDSIYDNTTYSSDNYKLLEAALENDKQFDIKQQQDADYEANDPNSTTNMNIASKAENLRLRKENFAKVTAERKVETDSFEKARAGYDAEQEQVKKDKAAVAANAKRIKSDKFKKDSTNQYNKYGDDEAANGGYNPDDFDNLDDAKAYYEDKKKVGDQKWWQKGFLDKRSEETDYEGDLKSHKSKMDEKNMLEQAMRNSSNNGSDETDSEWENQVDPVGMSQFSEQNLAEPGFPNYDEGPNMWGSPDPQYTDREEYERSLSSKKALKAWNNRKRIGN